MERYKKYTDPKSIGVWPLKDIKSHSSLLTNRRLDTLFERSNEAGIMAWNNICGENIQLYFSILNEIYNNVFPVFEPYENEKIVEAFKKFNTMFWNKETRMTLKNCVKMLLILDSIKRMIIGFLQKREYFFRLETKEPRGIEMALEITKRGMGVFEGGIRRVVKE